MEVAVHNNDIDRALRDLKRKSRQEGLMRELKRRIAYEKPSNGRAWGRRRWNLQRRRRPGILTVFHNSCPRK